MNNIFKLNNEIKGVFKQPKKRFYFGKIIYGTPYFNPLNFNSSIINIRKLKRRTPIEVSQYTEGKPWLENEPDTIFKNLPMVRRSKYWIVKLFGNDYYVKIGWPISVGYVSLRWKDKYGTPRFEREPMFYIFLFSYQFCIFWGSPIGEFSDKYYEQILWWKNYSDKDIDKARKSWGWVDGDTKVSTWSDKFLV